MRPACLLLFAAVFVIAGTQLPYLPVWLDWLGLSAREIAVITAAPMLVRVAVTPAIAFAADRSGDHRRFLIALAWAGLAAVVALSQSASFWPILVLTLLFAVATATVMPLTETVAMTRRQGRRARLRPHAAVGLAQLHRRQLLRRLGGGPPGSAGRRLDGGRRGGAHRACRAPACRARSGSAG